MNRFVRTLDSNPPGKQSFSAIRIVLVTNNERHWSVRITHTVAFEGEQIVHDAHHEREEQNFAVFDRRNQFSSDTHTPDLFDDDANHENGDFSSALLSLYQHGQEAWNGSGNKVSEAIVRLWTRFFLLDSKAT